MTIHVQANHKYIDEIQSVAQIFFPHARFGGENTPDYTIISTIEKGKVQAEIKCTGLYDQHTLELTKDVKSLPPKRQAMLATYRLLRVAIGGYAPWGSLAGVRPTKMVREWIAANHSKTKILSTLHSTLHVAQSRASLALEVAKAEIRLAAKINSPTPATPLGLYISIPFCPSRCVYCSFNTSSGHWTEAAQAQYIQAVIKELRRLPPSQFSSIYIGGGTPTALTNNNLAALLCAIQEVAPNPAEYTIEAGRPDTITHENLKLMRDYNVNRISINPQTLNDQTLKAIGRNHTTQDFIQAFRQAREAGFATINTDIIAGLPGEGPQDMRNTMEALSTLAPENITVHTLAIKRASKLNEQRIEDKAYTMTTASLIEHQLIIAHEACAALGQSPYYLYRQKNMAALFENTGFSLPGHECLYNIGMMSEVQTVLGVGAGAVSKYVEGDKITRKFNVKNPEIYIQRIM